MTYRVLVYNDDTLCHVASAQDDLDWLKSWIDAGNDWGPGTWKVEIVQVVATRERPRHRVPDLGSWK